MAWKDDLQNILDNPPKEGDIIQGLGDSKITVHIELIEGKPPFMYAICFVPAIVGSPVGWFARPEGDNSRSGWKLILLPRARDKILRKFGLAKDKVYVKSLKVIRPSREGKSLLVEVHEYDSRKTNIGKTQETLPADDAKTIQGTISGRVSEDGQETAETQR